MKTELKQHPDLLARLYDQYRKKNAYYHGKVEAFARQNVPPGSRVLEVGCGMGELLDHVKPGYGLGIDINKHLIECGQKKFPHLDLRVGKAEEFVSEEKFDYVLMVDLLDQTPDIWNVLQGVEPAVRPGTVLCLTSTNPFWQPLFSLAEALKLKIPISPYNFVPLDDIVNLLQVFDYEILKKEMRILVPKKIPLVSDVLNWIAPKIPGIRNLSAAQTLVARKLPAATIRDYTCSVVIPCHNEEGNIERCVRETPQMGKGTEIIFVNDGSTDGTLQKMKEMEAKYPYVKVVSYPLNRGKGYAVQQGFEAATGEILMILDADLTVPGSDLHQFYYILSHGKAGFVNGSRLVYPMENESMRTLNLWGNQFFGLIMSRLLGQRVSDTLCGTKALFKKDYLKMRMGQDQWGDYDLLFGAADLNLKIAEVPTHYKRRTAGVSKMKTFQHALLLAQICLRGFWNRKIKRRPPAPATPPIPVKTE